MEEVKDVTQESSPVQTTEVVTPTPAEGQTQEQVVTESTSQEQGNVQPNEASVEALTQEKEDVNWKNRAMEYERKLRQTVESIPKIIEETVSKAQVTKQEPQYSIADLRAFVDTTDNVENKRWAYSEIERLESEKIQKTVESLTRQKDALSEAQLVKKQVEQEVVNDPRFADAFVVKNGIRQWNFDNPITQTASQYMKDPSLANRPDGLRIAMKLAYADHANNSVGAVSKKLENTKTEITKLKQATLHDGGGVNNVRPKIDAVQQASIDLAKTGSKTALRTLTQAILKQQGLI